ncbi:hypothetical protein F5Y13DRAFT_157077, partial [Hypoxylon sp. FL1857]
MAHRRPSFVPTCLIAYVVLRLGIIPAVGRVPPGGNGTASRYWIENHGSIQYIKAYHKLPVPNPSNPHLLRSSYDNTL